MHEVRLLFSLLSQVGIWVVLLGTASAAAIAGDDVKTSLTDHDSGHSSLGLWLGGAALGAVFCVVVVVLLSQCMDCYNSEVASESHPACGQSKSDYTPVSTSFHHNSHVQPGGAPPPDVRAPLPYSLNPTPSASSSPPPVGPGGLGAQQWGSQPQPTGPRGLGAQQWGSPSPPQPTAPPATPQQGRPYNGPEQPPSYFEATARGGRV